MHEIAEFLRDHPPAHRTRQRDHAGAAVDHGAYDRQADRDGVTVALRGHDLNGRTRLLDRVRAGLDSDHEPAE